MDPSALQPCSPVDDLPPPHQLLRERSMHEGNCTLFLWLVLICCEIKVLLAGCVAFWTTYDLCNAKVPKILARITFFKKWLSITPHHMKYKSLYRFSNQKI
jgi:hypothetical protein